MSNVLLVLKPVGLSVIITAILAGVIGGLTAMVSPEHPHQIFPNWVILCVLGGFVALTCSLIACLVLIANGGLAQHQRKVIYISVATSIMVTLVLL